MVNLKHYPDKPWEQDPRHLDEWDRSGNYVCQQKIDGWRTVIILTDERIEYVSRHNKSLNRDVEPEIKKEAEILRKIFPVQTQLDAEWLSRRSCSKEYNLRPKMFLLDILRYGDTWLLDKKLRDREEILFKNPTNLECIAPPLAAEPGQFRNFYEAQKKISFSEGVVIKHLDSTIIGNRRECVKNPLIFKVKYRGGADGEQRMEHLKRR